MRFNKFLITTSLSALVLFSASCKKVLDEVPYNAFTEESVFTTPARAELALYGVYDAIQTGGPTLGGRGYPFGAANVQQGDNRGEDMVNLAAFYQFTYQGTYNSGTANNQAFWDNSYSAINKANIAIDGFKKVGLSGIISPALAIQYEAEARFLRALCHLEMLTHFARPYIDGNGGALGIPYRTTAIVGSATLDELRTQPRPTVAVGYTKALEDLNFAETNLPATQTLGALRARSSSAIALKMRAYMHMGNWASVRTEGNKLIPAVVNPLAPTTAVSLIGAHALLASPAGAFGSPGGNSITVENLFSVKNDPLDNGSVNGALASQYGSTDLGGRGLVSVSPIIWNNAQWLTTDTRRSTLYRTGNNAISSSIMTTKYTDYVGRGDNNPIIRWSEVLLMQAEAEARLGTGVTQRAIDLLNLVRNRASTSPATTQYTIASFADQAALVTAILLERRIEFLAEGKRWADIHRTAVDPIISVRSVGIPAKITNGNSGIALYGIGVPVTAGQLSIAYTDFRFIWPIPIGEVTQNPIIVQNPGY